MLTINIYDFLKCLLFELDLSCSYTHMQYVQYCEINS